ncbi:MAG: hypothetical protein WCQ23_00130 [Candidatus Methanomethylophilaceae archaeon]|jgi:hypothetical protein
MDKKVSAIIVVVILLAAGLTGAIYVLNNNNKETSVSYAGDVKIYGNANNDDTISSADIDVLNDLIVNQNYTETDYPYADADQDGEITASDVEVVQNIIDGKETIIYYVNYFDSVRTIHYPITGTIGTSF